MATGIRIRQDLESNIPTPPADRSFIFRDAADGILKVKKPNGSVVSLEVGTAVQSVNGQTGVVVLDADDISDASTTNKFITQADLDKLSNISVTQAVDLDQIETDVTANNTKVSASGSINTHSDVDISTTVPITGDQLVWNGTEFVPQAEVHPITTRQNMPTLVESQALAAASLGGNSAVWILSNTQLVTSNRADATFRALVSGLLDADGNEIPTTNTASNTIRLEIGTVVRIFSGTDFRIISTPNEVETAITLTNGELTAGSVIESNIPINRGVFGQGGIVDLRNSQLNLTFANTYLTATFGTTEVIDSEFYTNNGQSLVFNRAGRYRVSYKALMSTSGGNTRRYGEFRLQRANATNLFATIEVSQNTTYIRNSADHTVGNASVTFTETFAVNDRIRLQALVTSNNNSPILNAGQTVLLVEYLGE